MDKEYFIQKIEELVNDDVSEFIVEKEDFFNFREAWITHPNKNEIEGEASLGGKVIYRKVV